MSQQLLHTGALPARPLDAATAFHERFVTEARAMMAAADVVVVFEPAGHEHRAWRLAAIQELAREAAPRRVNAVASADGDAIAETAAYLATAPGITGQLLALDGNAGEKA